MYSPPNLLQFQKQLPRYTPAIIITLVYLAMGIIWIVWSDTVVQKIAHNNENLLYKMQSQKGLAFVALSGILLFLVSHALYRRIQKTDRQKITLENKIAVLHMAVRGGMIDYDTETKIAQINEKMKFFVEQKGTHMSDFLLRFLDRIHTADRERVRAEYEEAIKSEKTVWTTEYKVLGSDNNYYTVMSSLFLIRNQQGKITRLIGEIQDITQLRNLQQEYFNQQLKHKQRLANSIIKAQENERNRWAQELHDNISQMLTVINLYLSNTNVQNENNVTMIDQAKKFITEVQQEIRFLSASIKPPEFSIMTLEQSLKRLIADITRVKKIDFTYTATGLDESLLNDEQKLMIYRVVQEQLNNIIKYAEAKHIHIHLYSEDNIVHIELNDDGKGFDPKSIKTGLGFRNIQSRLQLFNGNMQLDSSPGKGCTLSVTFCIA